MTDKNARIYSGPIVVGLEPGLPPSVVETAKATAQAFDCELVFAFVEYEASLVGLEAMPLYPPATLHPSFDEEISQLVEEFRRSLDEALAGSGVDWSIRVIGGDVADALSLLADELDARMLIVGTRRSGAIHVLEELFTGSVGKRLAMAGRCPVLLVPLARNNPDT